MIARQTAVQTAISLKGKRNEIVDIYNNYFKTKGIKYPRNYRVKYEDMLCATFASSVFLSLDWADIVPPECGAMQLYRNMEALDRAVLDKKRVPEIGDLIFFGNGTKVSNINHVGIVTEVKGKQIYYYDLQSVVGRHTCPVGYSYIMGYGMPDYASKDVAPAPEPVPQTEEDFKVGDLVTINPGAKWYKGQSIKLSCINDEWFISSIKGDRAVLGMNKSETRNICSPINVADITLVKPKEPEAHSKVTISAVVSWDTLQLLEIMATGNNKTIGEIIDLLLEDAR